MATERCVGCGAEVPVVHGPVHRYMTAAPGCWAAFGALSARLASAPALAAARQYSVDAYAVQHPGDGGPQAVQSVAVHLVSLYAYLALGTPVHDAPHLLQRLAGHKGAYDRLPRPTFASSLSVLDVCWSDDPAAVTAGARAWARSAWEAWSAYHDRVAAWYRRYAV